MTRPHSIYLGRGDGGDVTSGPERSTLVLGPSRSGKTSCLIIPNLLMSNASCVVTSTKNDVLERVAHARNDVTTMLFDPSGTVTIPRGITCVGYSPLRQSFLWDGAILAARSLLDVARRGQSERGDDHWSERATTLVAPLLHASALLGDTLRTLCSRVDERATDEVMNTLVAHHGDDHASVTGLYSVLATEERERSSIWSTAAGLFAGLRTDAAREAAERDPINYDEFFATPHHLHIVSPSRHQRVSVPMVVGLLDEVVHATYDRHAEGARLLLALDELANVAPLPRLATIVSEGAGQGVLTLACFQDLSQARSRWGAQADGFLSLFPTCVILPGIADGATLGLLTSLSGTEHRPLTSVQRRTFFRRGRSTTWRERPRTTWAHVAQGRPGFALSFDATKSPRWIELTPAHRDGRFAAMTDGATIGLVARPESQ